MWKSGIIEVADQIPGIRPNDIEQSHKNTGYANPHVLVNIPALFILSLALLQTVLTLRLLLSIALPLSFQSSLPVFLLLTMDYFGMTWRSKSNQIKSPRKAYDALILSIPALSMLETELPYMANSNRWTTLGFVLSIITSLTHISHAYLTIFTILNLTLHFQALLPYTLYVYSTPILALFSSIPNSFALASFIEVAFYLFMTLKNQWYQSLNPSVYNLKTAPRNVTISQRSETFKCILRSEESKVRRSTTSTLRILLPLNLTHRFAPRSGASPHKRLVLRRPN